ncbi:MAG: hypothetical protein HYZ75_10800 [Elusimicrobia bacterium]|nr:hypothetical protein [Elusimicrobiota bacterium]
MRSFLIVLATAAAVCVGNASRIRGIPPPWTAALVLSAACLFAEWRKRRAAGQELLAAPAHLPVFLLCMSAYMATMRWHGGDDIPNSLIPFGILRHGTLSLEPFRAKFETETLHDFLSPVDGPLLSIFSVVPAVLALPVYILPAMAGGAPNDFGLHNLSKISGALITALSVVLVYEACLRRKAAERWAAACALFYGLGTWSWSVSSQALHSHGPAQLGTALGMLGLLGERPRDAALAGLGFSLAVASREDSVFFFAAAGLFILVHRPRGLVPFILGAAGPQLFNAAYWLWYTGVLRPPYLGAQGHMFGDFQARAVWGMVASPTRGLIFFSPAALFALWAMARASRDPERRWAPYLLAASAGMIVFVSYRVTWTGGQTFGTRYYAAACAIWTVALAELGPTIAASTRLRAAWAAAFAASAVVHAAGAFFPYPGSFMTQGAEAELWQWSLHPAANLFRAAGPMSGLPAPARLAAAAAFLAAGLPLARWAYRSAEANRRS